MFTESYPVKVDYKKDITVLKELASKFQIV